MRREELEVGDLVRFKWPDAYGKTCFSNARVVGFIDNKVRLSDCHTFSVFLGQVLYIIEPSATRLLKDKS